jgi:ribosomal protein S18 acetylase RimI-like enzyme
VNNIQINTSDEALITAIRANLCDFYRYLSRSIPEEHFENEKFTRWCSLLQHPWFNGVLSYRPPEPDDDAFVGETIQYFRSKQVDMFTWWMEPHLEASTWKSVLTPRGFGFSDDTPGMAADLQALNESAPSVERLEVCAVTEAESLRDWAHIFTLGYGLPPTWETSICDLWAKLGLDLPLRNYVGTLNGEPVATSSLFLGGGAAGIYSVATLPKARGKGIGAAMTLRPLQEARDMGYRIGVLESSEMGYGVYKKLGFRHLCQIEYFYLALR